MIKHVTKKGFPKGYTMFGNPDSGDFIRWSPGVTTARLGPRALVEKAQNFEKEVGLCRSAEGTYGGLCECNKELDAANCFVTGLRVPEAIAVESQGQPGRKTFGCRVFTKEVSAPSVCPPRCVAKPGTGATAQYAGTGWQKAFCFSAKVGYANDVYERDVVWEVQGDKLVKEARERLREEKRKAREAARAPTSVPPPPAAAAAGATAGAAARTAEGGAGELRGFLAKNNMQGYLEPLIKDGWDSVQKLRLADKDDLLAAGLKRADASLLLQRLQLQTSRRLWDSRSLFA